MKSNVLTTLMACLLISCGVGELCAGTMPFSDDFNDIAASPSGFSVKVFQDGGLVFSDGSPVNSYGGFIGSGATSQVVMVEDFNAGVGGSSALRMTLETFAQDDNTGAIAFFGGTYEDAAVFNGTVTPADIQSLQISFDYTTVLAGEYSIRLERLGGDFGNRVDLGTLSNTGGTFQSASFDLSAADPGQVSNLAGAINGSADPSILQIVFGNSGDPNTYQHTSSLIVDNLQIAVPEPCSFTLSLVFGLVCTYRRNRS